MKVVVRACEGNGDYWRMREFLREVYLLNDRLERGWHVARLDYTRWHLCLNCSQVPLEDFVYLWESGGRIVSVLIGDAGPVTVHLCVHPAFRAVELEEDMIAHAERHLGLSTSKGSRQLGVWATDGDTSRVDLLAARGYVRQYYECQWRRELQGQTPDASLPPGYAIRTVGEGLEMLERCYASGLGFHQGDIRVAVENRDDPTWYRNVQQAPLYRRDLDLVATAADGSVCSLCTVWFDDVTRSGYIQPVATVPAHRRRGLARAVVTEALNRVWRMGGTVACVTGVSDPANALYRAVMGPSHEKYAIWSREFSHTRRPG